MKGLTSEQAADLQVSLQKAVHDLDAAVRMADKLVSKSLKYRRVLAEAEHCLSEATEVASFYGGERVVTGYTIPAGCIVALGDACQDIHPHLFEQEADG